MTVKINITLFFWAVPIGLILPNAICNNSFSITNISSYVYKFIQKNAANHILASPRKIAVHGLIAMTC